MDDSSEAVFARVRALCLALPGTSETQSWVIQTSGRRRESSSPVNASASRPSIAFRLEPDEVQHFLAMKGFFVTPYGRGRWVSLDAGGRLNWKLVSTLIDKGYATVS